MKSVIIYILLIIIGSLLLLSQRPQKASSTSIEQQAAPEQVIMSIRELQQALNDKGHKRYYCGKVDGKPGPKLFRAWSNWICDRNYKESTYE